MLACGASGAAVVGVFILSGPPASTAAPGQLLVLEGGRGLTQVRGEAVYEMRPFGAVVHGGRHRALARRPPWEETRQLTIYGGTVNWLEPVEDAVYRAPSRRRWRSHPNRDLTATPPGP